MLVAQSAGYEVLDDLSWYWDEDQSRYKGMFFFISPRTTMIKSRRVDFPRWICVA